jgi:hypothetical protein
MAGTAIARNEDSDTDMSTSSARTASRQISTDSDGTLWSGMETDGMMQAKCSLLLQEEAGYDARIKALPRQRVAIYQDKSIRLDPASKNKNANDETNIADGSPSGMATYDVDFGGATILQLEPVMSSSVPVKSMPITMTVGGRCVFTPENYKDFRVMMRTKEQSHTNGLVPNGSFDWPDVSSLLLCPVCGCTGQIPETGDCKDHEYWMVFYPLLQITQMKKSLMTLGTRTICRLTCLDCMEDLLEGLTLQIQPGSTTTSSSDADYGSVNAEEEQGNRNTRLSFTLPASDVLAEAGSASFLEDGPPRPDTHPHVDDILDAWTLYNLWEQSGAWEALQNDYRLHLSNSMRADPVAAAAAEASGEPRLKERLGRSCGNPDCTAVHGKADEITGEMTRLVIRCRDCNQEYYCSVSCKEAAAAAHHDECWVQQRLREEKREKRAKKVQCDTCQRNFPFTKMKKCSRCRKATYCSVDCQRLDWQRHRDVCC